MQYCVDHPEEINKLAKVKAPVSEVEVVMMENIEKLRDFGNYFCAECISKSFRFLGQGGGMAYTLSSGGSLNFDSVDNSLDLGRIGFSRNTSSNIAPTSSMYASPKLDGFGLFNNELNNDIFDVTPRDVVHYAEGYNANNTGTTSSKKKMKSKLQRVSGSMKKQQRQSSEKTTTLSSYSPLNHLNDAQNLYIPNIRKVVVAGLPPIGCAPY
ncbi:hypothetical protein AgCh_006809 [Apium graveolens]